MAQELVKPISTFGLVGTIAAYLTLNSTLNLMNKWLLGIYGFQFPLLLTSCHMLFSFMILLPVMLTNPFKALHLPTLCKQWKGIVCIGMFMAVNIAFNNLSLVSITLSLNQVIRQVSCCCPRCGSSVLQFLLTFADNLLLTPSKHAGPSFQYSVA